MDGAGQPGGAIGAGPTGGGGSESVIPPVSGTAPAPVGTLVSVESSAEKTVFEGGSDGTGGPNGYITFCVTNANPFSDSTMGLVPNDSLPWRAPASCAHFTGTQAVPRLIPGSTVY